MGVGDEGLDRRVWMDLRRSASAYNREHAARRVAISIRYRQAVTARDRSNAIPSVRTLAVLACAVGLVAVRWLVFPTWSPTSTAVGVCLAVAIAGGLVWQRINTIVLGDRRGGYLGLHRAHGCVEVVAWHYLPREGPQRGAARQSAYDVASAVVGWADEQGICLAATPATEWHAALYREMGFRSPQSNRCRVTVPSKVAARWRGTPPASIRLPLQGMSADQIAAIGAVS